MFARMSAASAKRNCVSRCRIHTSKATALLKFSIDVHYQAFSQNATSVAELVVSLYGQAPYVTEDPLHLRHLLSKIIPLPADIV